MPGRLPPIAGKCFRQECERVEDKEIFSTPDGRFTPILINERKQDFLMHSGYPVFLPDIETREARERDGAAGGPSAPAKLRGPVRP